VADPQLIVFAGLPGTGKSSLARAVARQRRAVYLDKDTVKDGVMALAEELRLSQGRDLSGPLSYALLVDLARDNLSLGLSVVLDSPADYREYRDKIKQLARSLKADLRWIECICSDEELLRQRVESRAPELPAHRTRDWATYEHERSRFERLTDRKLVVDTAEALALNLRKVLLHLDQVAQGTASE
jgi:predicted kinase